MFTQIETDSLSLLIATEKDNNTKKRIDKYELHVCFCACLFVACVSSGITVDAELRVIT